MDVLSNSESHDHVLLQYYKQTNVLPHYHVQPPTKNFIGALPKLYNRPSRVACYKVSSWPVVTQTRSVTMVKSKQKSAPRKPNSTRLVPLEKSSCGVAMEVAKADSKTNWEELMRRINESIRDSQQQRMLGQYMIQKLKKEQQLTNLSQEQQIINRRCLENLVERYGTGMEAVISKEKEFERMIEAYQVFMRGDKGSRIQRGRVKGERRTRLEEPLPAIGDQKAGRSQVGCKIRHELRKEYGERIRLETKGGSGGQRSRSLVTQPGQATRPMQVRVRKTVSAGQRSKHSSGGDKASDEVDLPPTPITPRGQQELEESESQLSMTYVPSENQSLAQLIPDDEGITVDIRKEEKIEEEPQEAPEPQEAQEAEEEEEENVLQSAESEECLILEGDSDPDILIVNPETEVTPLIPAQSPKFEIVPAGLAKGEGEVREEPQANEEELLEVREDAQVEGTVEKMVVESVATEEPVPEVVDEVHLLEEKAGDPSSIAKEPMEDLNSTVIETTGEPNEPSMELEQDLLEIAAVNLVNEVLKKIDTESEESMGEERVRLIHFDSSPEIVYYEKEAGEEELACHPDEKLILTEDLSTAETELEEDAKALYHRVLSTAHTEPDPALSPRARRKAEEKEEEDLQLIARELTDEAIKSATRKETETLDTERVGSPVTEAARSLTSSVLSNAQSMSS